MDGECDAWRGPAAAWATSLRAAGRSPQTIGLRAYHLRRLAAWATPRGPWDLTLSDLAEWLGSVDWSRATLRSMRASLRSFYAWAVRAGHIDASPADGLPSPGLAPPNPHPAPEDAYRLALAMADDREWLMLRLAADCGLRRCEVAQVHRRDVHRDLLGWALRVHGKGGKQRTVPLPDDVAWAILERDGYAFPGNVGGHLSAKWVGKLVARLLPEGWAMHSLRHRFAVQVWRVDHDLLTTQELLGHASPVTTRAYVPADEEAKRRHVDAVAALSI